MKNETTNYLIDSLAIEKEARQLRANWLKALLGRNKR